MPGHVKRGGTGEPDPDPTEYLFITYEEKQKVLQLSFMLLLLQKQKVTCPLELSTCFRTLPSHTTPRKAAGSL